MSEKDDLAEIITDLAETSAILGRTALADGPIERSAGTIHDAYFEQIESMHGVQADPASIGRVGRLWNVDERFGEGIYWYYPIDDIMTVNVYDMGFIRDTVFTCNTPDLFCFGSYGRNMVPYFGISEDPADRTLVGYAWKGQVYTQKVYADKHLDVTSICLLPQGLRRISRMGRWDPLMVSRAIARLDGSADVPGLNIVFDEIRRARPSEAVAAAYYEAKIVEAVALLVDWSLATPGGAHAIRAADRAALTLARTHVRDNLDRAVSTDELCHIACMSASKLTRLFKQAEGVTPQEYARMMRMTRACELLEGTDLTMAEVASALGFARQGSFSEAFKARFGVAPHAYRTAARERIGR